MISADEILVVDDALEGVRPADDVFVVDDGVDVAQTSEDALSVDVLDALESYSSKQDVAIADLAGDLAGVHDDVRALAKTLDEGAKADSSNTVVVLSDSQWSEIRDAWGWCKGGFSVALFLVLVCTLVVSCLLGNRLWAAFVEGWRR